MPARAQLGGRLVQQRARLCHLLTGGDHREHDVDLAVQRRSQDRPQLRLEELRHGQRDANGTPAQERIGLGRQLQVGRWLVAADVQRADHHRPAGHRFGHGSVDLILLLLGGRRETILEEKLGAQQADPFRARQQRAFGLGGGGQVGDHFDAVTVSGARLRLRGGVSVPAGRPDSPARCARNAATVVVVGIDDDRAGRAVNGQLHPGREMRQSFYADAYDRGDAHAARQNRTVRRRPAQRGAEPDDLVAIQRGGLRWRQIVGDDNGFVGQVDTGRPVAAQHSLDARIHIAQVDGRAPESAGRSCPRSASPRSRRRRPPRLRR